MSYFSPLVTFQVFCIVCSLSSGSPTQPSHFVRVGEPPISPGVSNFRVQPQAMPYPPSSLNPVVLVPDPTVQMRPTFLQSTVFPRPHDNLQTQDGSHLHKFSQSPDEVIPTSSAAFQLSQNYSTTPVLQKRNPLLAESFTHHRGVRKLNDEDLPPTLSNTPHDTFPYHELFASTGDPDELTEVSSEMSGKYCLSRDIDEKTSSSTEADHQNYGNISNDNFPDGQEQINIPKNNKRENDYFNYSEVEINDHDVDDDIKGGNIEEETKKRISYSINIPTVRDQTLHNLGNTRAVSFEGYVPKEPKKTNYNLSFGSNKNADSTFRSNGGCSKCVHKLKSCVKKAQSVAEYLASTAAIALGF